MKGEGMMCKNFRIMFMAGMAALMLTGCGAVDDKEEAPVFTTTTTVSSKPVHTTKIATAMGEVDADDEGIEGYSQTTTSITGSLATTTEMTADAAIRATQRTAAETYYTIPEHNGTTAAAVTVSPEKTTTTANGTVRLGEESETTRATEETTTTAVRTDALYPLDDSMRYGSQTDFTVVSDTTFLNLRFGPSKGYDIRLTIPDGSKITGLGETSDDLGNVWVYTSYNGTYGWVMRELLRS